MKLIVRSLLGIMLAALGHATSAQQFERLPVPADEPRPMPYLGGQEVDFRTTLGPPPIPRDDRDRQDVRAVEAAQSVSSERWTTAQLDDEFVYSRFDDAFGHPIDRTFSLILVQTLNRTLVDVSASTFAAKAYFQRPRPYQRLSLTRVCGEAKPPKPEPYPTGGSSYPSGHSAYGWAVAMVLARVAPQRADALMARAEEYAQSRVICGVHFPSDVEAGHVIAVAVVARLDANPEFQADLARVRSSLSPQPTP